MSWQWRMMQNLKRNWLVISKLTWGIWWILTQALESVKNFHFNVLLLSKVYVVWAKKSSEELSFMKLKRDTKFGEKSIRCLKIGVRNLTKFDPGTWKSQKFSFYWAPFEQNCILWAKKVQRNSLSRNWREIQNFARNRIVDSKLA